MKNGTMGYYLLDGRVVFCASECGSGEVLFVRLAWVELLPTARHATFHATLVSSAVAEKPTTVTIRSKHYLFCAFPYGCL